MWRWLDGATAAVFVASAVAVARPSSPCAESPSPVRAAHTWLWVFAGLVTVACAGRSAWRTMNHSGPGWITYARDVDPYPGPGDEFDELVSEGRYKRHHFVSAALLALCGVLVPALAIGNSVREYRRDREQRERWAKESADRTRHRAALTPEEREREDAAIDEEIRSMLKDL